MPTRTYRVVQPYGQRQEEWSVQSEHASIHSAFAAIEALKARMMNTGAPSDAIELIVVDDQGLRIQGPSAN